MNEDIDNDSCADSNNCDESQIIATVNPSDTVNAEDCIKTELETDSVSDKFDGDSSLDMTKNKDYEPKTENDGEDKVSAEIENCESNVESQTSEDKAEDVIEPKTLIDETNIQPLTEEKILEVTQEDKNKPSDYSFSEWSENYESLEDDRPMEDVSEDPEKFILWASEKDEVEIVRKLLEEDPNLVNAKDNDLYTPLHRAAYSNSVEVIKLLLSYDADITARTTDGWEPLHCACKWDSVEAVSLLLQNGADINALTKGNITPLHLAASNSSGRRTLEFLLWQPYMDPNVKNDAGDTPYDVAYRTGPLGDMFEMLEVSVNEY